ncbi:sucrose-phosphate phosphatase [Nostoc sp. 'Peltigera membranacea cyanobiont' 232]|uniref:sucrose-phosphate phosphatase n=1 Tax=Nostoc sp. 'Peltigera membranacea cyanobiont' 232 TaxID=2014531 RepID=UPI000B958857|nr:sucrose-phosphate phosphatase [Nostoc sp. 'Peltigera membranacea cyanobiont' 232]OYE03688.1 sucrose-phosphate phosphatase [Nostoc sp. 'Peltigera membranacea cyanobiont' 232]
MSSFLFVTDLDHTLVGDYKALEKLNHELEQHRKDYGTKIVYATGRSLTLYKELIAEQPLLTPDALITSVGTEIYFDSQEYTPDSEWSEKLSDGWNRNLIVEIATAFPELVPQKESEQRPFKVSYLISEENSIKVLPQLKSQLESKSLKFNLIYSGGKDLDILSLYADKGLAVKFLQYKWEINSATTVVCGDSGNDIALFSAGEERGIIVGNARPELLEWYKANSTDYRYLAKSSYANGILEGLRHFNFI